MFNVFMCYLDGVVVFFKTLSEHVIHLREVLGRMRGAGLTINPPKEKLTSNRINLLGFVIDNRTLMRNEEKLTAILEYPRPSDVKSMARFGMLGFT